MSERTIQILHLTAEWLRWASLDAGSHPALRGVGQVDGAPAQTLEAWALQKADLRAPIRLYDGRTRFLTLVQRLPRRALAQKDNLVRLKLRQELGLGDEALFWSAAAGPEEPGSDQSDVLTIVARREALADVVEWRARHDLGALWVGADLCAIRALLSQAPPGAGPTMIVSVDPGRATLYQADGGQQVLKASVAVLPRLADLGWKLPAARAHFKSGGAETNGEWLARGAPELAHLPELPLSSWTARYPSLASRAPELDPVLLGGIMDALGAQAAGAMAMPSLLPEIPRQAPARKLVERWTVRQLAAAAIAAALLLGGALWFLHATSGGALSRLTRRGSELRGELAAYRSQQAVLRRIKADRRPTMGVFQALLEAAPQGVAVESLQLGETGIVQISGSAPSPDAPNQFIKGLADTGVFENVALGSVGQDSRGRGQTFSLTAHVKGWGR